MPVPGSRRSKGTSPKWRDEVGTSHPLKTRASVRAPICLRWQRVTGASVTASRERFYSPVSREHLRRFGDANSRRRTPRAQCDILSHPGAVLVFACRHPSAPTPQHVARDGVRSLALVIARRWLPLLPPCLAHRSRWRSRRFGPTLGAATLPGTMARWHRRVAQGRAPKRERTVSSRRITAAR